MSKFSLRGRCKKGRRGGEKRESGTKGREGTFPYLLNPPSLFLFLSIPYPLSTPATQVRVNYAAILAGQSKKLNK